MTETRLFSFSEQKSIKLEKCNVKMLCKPQLSLDRFEFQLTIKLMIKIY